MPTRLVVLLAALSCASVVTACPLDPAKTPQCTGDEGWPDPCAAASPAMGSADSLPSLCASAAVGLQRAGCAEGFPTPGGVTFVTVCQTSSKLRAWPLKCWGDAETRVEVLACGPQMRCLSRQ